jgi:hypothetical protein
MQFLKKSGIGRQSTRFWHQPPCSSPIDLTGACLWANGRQPSYCSASTTSSYVPAESQKVVWHPTRCNHIKSPGNSTRAFILQFPLGYIIPLIKWLFPTFPSSMEVVPVGLNSLLWGCGLFFIASRRRLTKACDETEQRS